MKNIFGVFLCAFAMFFVACGDDDVKISSGNNTDSETLKKIENMDKQSYAGLEDVFSDTKNLQSNGKTMLIVFGKENCVYCEKLKDDLKANDELKHILKDNFSAYYVNTDYSKIHNFAFKDSEFKIDTLELARQFRVNATPALAFLDSQGESFFTYPGYMKPNALKALLQRVQNIQLDGVDKNQLSMELVKLINTNS